MVSPSAPWCSSVRLDVAWGGALVATALGPTDYLFSQRFQVGCVACGHNPLGVKCRFAEPPHDPRQGGPCVLALGTSMKLKPAILSTLGRDRLKRLVDALELPDVDRRSVEAMRGVLSRSRRATPQELLTRLDKATLKAVCEEMGVPSKGVRDQLIQRLLGDGSPKQATKVPAGKTRMEKQKELPLRSGTKLDVSALENWLWEAACVVRGPLDAPKYKDYILPLVFLKRLSDVFDDEIAHLAHDFGSVETTLKLVQQDHKLVRFFLPQKARWPTIAQKTTGLGEHLTDAMRSVARENPRLQGVIDVTDYNATTAGQRIVDDGRLVSLVQVLNNPDYRLGLDDVEPDILGRAYEYLLRKFAEGQGQSGGEQFTPREVGIVIAKILDPQPGMTVYDPCCGSGGLLIKCHLRLLETKGKKENGRVTLPSNVAPLRLFGQEIEASTFAISRMNAFVHDMEAEIALGDTMRRPAFTEGDGSLRQFDIVTANPMWNQDFTASTYENDPYERFQRGTPPASSADWGWVQHMLASLKPGGRIAVVLDTGAVSRGSGNQGSNKERDVRKQFVEDDLIEAVLMLPENLFYNTTAPGIVMVVNRRKRHKGEILLINASKLFSKGRPKNFLDDQHIAQIGDVYHRWEAVEGVSAIIAKEDAVKSDYNLSPSRYVATDGQEEVVPLEEAVVFLREAEEERAEADKELNKVLKKLGFGGWKNG